MEDRGALEAKRTPQAVEDCAVSSHVTAREAAHGIVLGSPFRAEIERLDPSAPERAAAAVEEALEGVRNSV